MEFHGYDFAGPLGVSVMTIGLPLLCYAFAFLCNDISGCPVPSTLHPYSFTIEKLKTDVAWQGLSSVINLQSVIATFGYYALSLVLNAVLPSQTAEGTVLSSGGRLQYRFNSFLSALFQLSILAAGTVLQGADFVVWTFINDNFVQIMSTNILFSAILATIVYVRSFSVKPKNPDNRELAAGGISGNLIYDWFIGRELNPRVQIPLIGEIDIKCWMEMRPGLFGWILLDLAFVARQYKSYGLVTDSMLLIVVSQTIYVLDALYMETAILTTIDITTDGFGFMLAFGDVGWLPFIYSVQARYLAIHPVVLGWSGSLAVLAVLAFGYYVFRAANNEKNRFRTNPKDERVSHLEYIQTKRGSKLITSGWWGRARHINYLGDWIMSWAYCLPTGIAGYQMIRDEASAVKGAYLGGHLAEMHVYPGEARGYGMIFTYFFMLYFATLLIHRERRDEAKCRAKYGKDWEEYCRRVPSRIVPGVY